MIPRSPREKLLLLLLLVGALLLCHGVFGAVHLACDDPPECGDGAAHAAEHQPTVGTAGDAHEHPANHATSTEYFAVVAGLLGVLLRLLSKGTWLRITLGMRWSAVFRRAPAVFRPPPTPTALILQVLSL